MNDNVFRAVLAVGRHARRRRDDVQRPHWMSTQGIFSFHSDAPHVTERYHRTASNALDVEKTYEDPKVLFRTQA